MEIKKGSKVWLKTGGPAMTVKIDTDMIIGAKAWICSWFNGNKDLQEETFTEEQLTTEEPDVY